MAKKPKSNLKSKSLFAILTIIIFTLVGIQVKLPQYSKVVRVVDGDNFETEDGRRIRLINVDTPEKGECFREESTKASTELLLNKKVKIEKDTNEMDRFGRTLAYVFLKDGTFVNKKLLEEGVAEFQIDTVNLKYQGVLTKAAEDGHDQVKGLWSVCAPDPEKGCLVKGNVDKRGKRRYILPESRYYKNSIIRFDKEDRWFCTEDKAIKAGFIKARL
jgi:micrococcal nuclease